MEESDQKFFEQLAKFSGVPKQEVEVELAKASTEEKPVATTAKTPAKKQTKATAVEEEGSLTIDVYQTPSDIVVESAIAGVKPEDIDIEVTTDSVTIHGERSREEEISENDYFYQECYWGKFSRSVILPQEVDPESASVTFKGGILAIRLPKLNRKRTKKLKVQMD